MSGIDCERGAPWANLHSKSSKSSSVELRSGICAGHSGSSTPTANHVFMHLASHLAALPCWSRLELDCLVPVKVMHTAYKYIKWLQFWGKHLQKAHICRPGQASTYFWLYCMGQVLFFQILLDQIIHRCLSNRI